MNDTGDFLRRARKEKYLTQADVAERLNVTPQAVSKWELGTSMPDIMLLPEIAEIYEIEVQDIFTQNIVSENNFFTRAINNLETIKTIQEINFPAEAFLFLNRNQKNILLDALLNLEDCGLILDEFFPYMTINQRNKAILNLLYKNDFDSLEPLIIFMSKQIKTEVLEYLINSRSFEFIEDMMPYLNREQRNKLIDFLYHNSIDEDIICSFMPFFDIKQKRFIEESIFKNQEEE